MIILASDLQSSVRDENNQRTPCKMPDANGVLSLIAANLKKRENFLFVANDPADREGNDAYAGGMFRAFELSGMPFKTLKILDNRTIKDAPNLVKWADFVHLAGGRIPCQMDFFNKVSLKKLLTEYERENRGVVVGTSAGAMCCCREICNFPEDLADIPGERFIAGMGFTDLSVIPHFDAKTKTYQNDCPEVDVVAWIMKLSQGRTFNAFPDGSYITLHNGETKFHGDHYTIQNGNISKAKIPLHNQGTPKGQGD